MDNIGKGLEKILADATARLKEAQNQSQALAKRIEFEYNGEHYSYPVRANYMRIVGDENSTRICYDDTKTEEIINLPFSEVKKYL